MSSCIRLRRLKRQVQGSWQWYVYFAAFFQRIGGKIWHTERGQTPFPFLFLLYFCRRCQRRKNAARKPFKTVVFGCFWLFGLSQKVHRPSFPAKLGVLIIEATCFFTRSQTSCYRRSYFSRVHLVLAEAELSFQLAVVT